MWTLISFPMARLARHWLWALLAALLLAAGTPASAQPVLQLDAASSISTGGYLALLRDPGGLMDADTAARATSWRVLPGSVKLGYTDDAVWLRLNVQRGEVAQTRWLLKFSSALLDDVRLYRRDRYGNWQLVQRSGEEQDRRSWPIDARSPVLPLQLDGVEPESLLLRVQTRNALTTRLDIATPELHGAESQRESFYYGLGLGFGLLLILFHALFWLKTREAVNVWYVVYVGLALQSEWLTSGLAQQTLGLPGWLSDYWLSLVLCAALPVGVFYSDRAACCNACHWGRDWCRHAADAACCLDRHGDHDRNGCLDAAARRWSGTRLSVGVWHLLRWCDGGLFAQSGAAAQHGDYPECHGFGNPDTHGCDECASQRRLRQDAPRERGCSAARGDLG
ncbi:MAG: 7TM-DISM domain-containing protein [Comamonas sp.]